MKRRKPQLPEDRSFGLCLVGKVQREQCAWCKRNWFRYDHPDSGDFMVHVMSKSMITAADRGECPCCLDDVEARKAYELRQKRTEAMAWTKCRGCKYAGFDDGECEPRCHRDSSYYFEQPCPRDGCEKYRKWISDEKYQERLQKRMAKIGLTLDRVDELVGSVPERIPTADELWEQYEREKNQEED